MGPSEAELVGEFESPPLVGLEVALAPELGLLLGELGEAPVCTFEAALAGALDATLLGGFEGSPLGKADVTWAGTLDVPLLGGFETLLLIAFEAPALTEFEAAAAGALGALLLPRFQCHKRAASSTSNTAVPPRATPNHAGLAAAFLSPAGEAPETTVGGTVGAAGRPTSTCGFCASKVFMVFARPRR
jgi:hypothetical protein